MSSSAVAPPTSQTGSLGRSVSIEQAARLLDVSRRTIYNRIREGRLRTLRTLGGSQRVLVESLRDNGYAPAALSAPDAAPSTPAEAPGGPFTHRQGN